MSVEDWKLALREDDRIKHGVDYAVACKYGELRIYCHAVYQSTIVERAVEYGLTVTSIETWENRPTPARVVTDAVMGTPVGHSVQLTAQQRNVLLRASEVASQIRDELRRVYGEDAEHMEFDTAMAEVEHNINDLLEDPKVRG